MKTIGLIGGMSWESTAVYYRRLNEEVRRRFGGLRSADILLRSLDFARVVALQGRGAWDEAAAELAGAAHALEIAGAGVILICTNTMHKVAPAVQAAITVPLLHIADATGAAVVAAGHRRPLLLATRYTMEQDFYVERLREGHGLDPLVPAAAARTTVHDVIFEELCRGIVRDELRDAFRVIMKSKGAGTEPTASSSAARKSTCWWGPVTPACRSSTQPASCRRRPRSGARRHGSSAGRGLPSAGLGRRMRRREPRHD